MRGGRASSSLPPADEERRGALQRPVRKSNGEGRGLLLEITADRAGVVLRVLFSVECVECRLLLCKPGFALPFAHHMRHSLLA